MRKRVLRQSVCSAVSALALLAATSTLAVAEETGANSPEYYGDWRGWAYSPHNQIDTGNLANLKVAWIHQPGDIAQGLEATPIALDGIAYYSGSNNRIFALDAATGKAIWHYYSNLKPIAKRSIFGFYNRGVSVGKGKVFVGSSDGRVIAIDQKTDATQLVFAHHLGAFSEGIDSILADYTEKSVLMTPDATYRGLHEIRGFFDAFLRSASQEFWNAFRIGTQAIDGEVAYLTWSAEPFIALATDTLLVRDGKILVQTFTPFKK